jgi:hypothetical protein
VQAIQRNQAGIQGIEALANLRQISLKYLRQIMSSQSYNSESFEIVAVARRFRAAQLVFITLTAVWI